MRKTKRQPGGKRRAVAGGTEQPPNETHLLDVVRTEALRAMSFRERQSTNLYLLRDVLKKGDAVQAHRQKIRVQRPSLVVFADKAPRFNWAHPCEYQLFDVETGQKYETVRAQFPPYLTSVPDDFRPFHEPIPLEVASRLWPMPRWFHCPIRLPRGRRYAVLFSGASNNRHVNDMEFLYRTLVDVYRFRESDIYVLNYDGTLNYSGSPKPIAAWPGDGTAYRMPVGRAGTRADLDDVFDELKKKLKANDHLLIHTNNHGGWAGWGQAYLCTYSGSDYYAADFGAKLAQLPRFNTLTVMMEQCHSGGFNSAVIANSPADHTSIASACEEDKNSIGGAHFDPFARDWIAAMTGHDPYGSALAFNPDSDGTGKVSAREAFGYADAIHDPYDTPVYSSTSLSADRAHLGQRYVWWWWWFCPLVHEILRPHWLRLPEPEFRKVFTDRLSPALDRLSEQLDRKDEVNRKTVERDLNRLITQAFR